MHSVSTVGQNELFWKIRHFISKWCNSRYCVFVFAYLCICVFVFGLRCLKPGQKFRKFNSDHFPFFKNLKRTSGSKFGSFQTARTKKHLTKGRGGHLPIVNQSRLRYAKNKNWRAPFITWNEKLRHVLNSPIFPELSGREVHRSPDHKPQKTSLFFNGTT